MPCRTSFLNAIFRLRVLVSSVQPSSRLKLQLHAKRFLHHDILVGTHDILLPLGPTSDLSFDLSKGNNKQAGQSTQPVTVYLKVIVSGNATSSPGDTTDLVSEANNPPTENTADRYKARGLTQDTPETAVVAAPTEPLSNQTDHIPVEISASTSPSPPADARAEAPLTGEAHDSDKVTRTIETAEGGGAHQSDPSTSTTTERENTIDDILKTVERFRILSVGRSGVGKSSLINRVFGIDAAHVEDNKPGEADIQQEFVSPDNRFFVLHDSKGFEPGDLSNFDTVREFIKQRSRPELPLGERIHGLWLCTETPTAGGRVFETGDEKLLQFAHKDQVPIVIVFTQYDRLVRTKEAELKEEHPNMDPTRLHDRGMEEAQKAFQECLQSLKRTMNRLGIPMPRYARVSVRPHHQEDVSSLVKVTRDVVKERVKGDAWVLWAIAQRASLPVKIDACVTKGISYYRRSLMAHRRGMPESRPMLLRDCIGAVHKDIITCWNFKGEVLNSPEFRQLMLCLVQDVHTKPNVSILPNVDIISQFVDLVTAAPAPIAPPVAILGLSYVFVKWLSTTHLESSIHSVQRLLIAYTVDLVGVLRELFDITLRPDLALTTTWKELQVAFESYERSYSRQRIHNGIYSNTARGQQMTVEDISRMVSDLLSR
ncbi:hypothetical protein EDB92DRAFT_1891264 [Lactarius akahatsu]|uniref:G domain-containing protein n=1 Tax=Lactarius akahatsu TaxID=416441 RepID=A0AAD4L313_9AGAM|nr:hypothetical protein EDB92DRAFT_1918665 [Lactarius akahatsu]KAH8983283.1 hypothetical protein EDB92DRAFT_1891264 [Lactarius akahatsu]